VGYVVDTVAAVLTGDSSPVLSQYTFVGEFALAVWLTIHGRRTTTRGTTLGDAPSPAPLLASAAPAAGYAARSVPMHEEHP
jgi:hypothetical protein